MREGAGLVWKLSASVNTATPRLDGILTRISTSPLPPRRPAEAAKSRQSADGMQTAQRGNRFRTTARRSGLPPHRLALRDEKKTITTLTNILSFGNKRIVCHNHGLTWCFILKYFPVFLVPTSCTADERSEIARVTSTVSLRSGSESVLLPTWTRLLSEGR